MPPWARAPATSYCPATRSPAASLAVKSKRSPQLGQNPDVRPGRSPWPRPTGLSQRVQKRRFSGTLGSAMTTADGSALATGGISMMPAPTRLRRVLRLPVVCPLRVVSRETSTRPDVRADTGADPPGPTATAGAAAADDRADALGAMPQVSQ